MKKLLTCAFLLCFLLSSQSLAAGSAPEKPKEVAKEAKTNLKNIIDKIRVNQSKINDMYAETTSTITSNVAIEKGVPKKMVQKGKMWTKGKDKSKIEMTSPMRQITIINGDKMAVINPDTGKKRIKDLKKEGSLQPSRDMNLEKAMEYFDLSASKSESGEHVITGIPKITNKFIGKMEFYIDQLRWVPVKILMYNPSGKLLSQSKIEYNQVKTGDGKKVWAPVKNNSTVNTPVGEMGMVTEFGNIKINEGVGDGEFNVN
jgi:outer membrane lipoprotein-sorting protein